MANGVDVISHEPWWIPDLKWAVVYIGLPSVLAGYLLLFQGRQLNAMDKSLTTVEQRSTMEIGLMEQICINTSHGDLAAVTKCAEALQVPVVQVDAK